MRIGILGGTFNPIHIGHIRLGVEVKEKMELDEVHFVPSYHPPHKKNIEILPFDKRCELVEKAISHIPGFKINRIEKELGKTPSYTFFTLTAYKSLYPKAELFFILSSKDFILLPTWYKWKEVIQLTDFIVAGKDEDFEKIDEFLKKNFSFVKRFQNAWTLDTSSIFFITIPELEISSSMIREKIKKGKSISCLVPFPVEKLILNLFK